MPALHTRHYLAASVLEYCDFTVRTGFSMDDHFHAREILARIVFSESGRLEFLAESVLFLFFPFVRALFTDILGFAGAAFDESDVGASLFWAGFEVSLMQSVDFEQVVVDLSKVFGGEDFLDFRVGKRGTRVDMLENGTLDR